MNNTETIIREAMQAGLHNNIVSDYDFYILFYKLCKFFKDKNINMCGNVDYFNIQNCNNNFFELKPENLNFESTGIGFFLQMIFSNSDTLEESEITNFLLGGLDNKLNADVKFNYSILEFKKDEKSLNTEISDKFFISRINSFHRFFGTEYSFIGLMNNDSYNKFINMITKDNYIDYCNNEGYKPLNYDEFKELLTKIRKKNLTSNSANNQIIQNFNYEFLNIIKTKLYEIKPAIKNIEEISFFIANKILYKNAVNDILSSNIHEIIYPVKNESKYYFYTCNYIKKFLYNESSLKFQSSNFNNNTKKDFDKYINFIYSFNDSINTLYLFLKDDKGNNGIVPLGNSHNNQIQTFTYTTINDLKLHINNLIKKEQVTTVQTEIALKKKYVPLINSHEKIDEISNNTKIVEQNKKVKKLVLRRKF